MLHNESPETQGCGHTPPSWKILLQLGSSADAGLAGLSLGTCQHWEGRQERKKKGWTVFRNKETLGEEPQAAPEVGQSLRGHQLSLLTEEQAPLPSKPLKWAESEGSDSHPYLNPCSFPQDRSETRKVTYEC